MPDGHPVVAAVLDVVMAPMKKLRPRVVQHAAGTVLELGVGTGANLGFYAEDVDLHGVEPDPHMLRRARRRAERLGRTITLHPVGAERLPYPEATFDVVIATWVFCTIPDVPAAAAEVFRVLKPGGRLVFVEHVRGTHPSSRLIQDALQPVWPHLAGGCHLDRDPVPDLRDAGLRVEDVRPWGRQAFSVAPMLRGDAVKP